MLIFYPQKNAQEEPALTSTCYKHGYYQAVHRNNTGHNHRNE